jgi:hypothetical protein
MHLSKPLLWTKGRADLDSEGRLKDTPPAEISRLNARLRILLCMESATPTRDTAWAMSEENVEAVRQMFQGLESR